VTPKLGSRSFVRASFTSRGSTRRKIGSTDTASPIATAPAAHRSPSRPFVRNGPQGAEHCHAQDQAEVQAQAGSGERSGVAVGPVFRVEVDSPQQCAGHRELDRDDRLEVPDGHIRPWRMPSLGYWSALAGGLVLAMAIVASTLPLLSRITSLESARFE
jgi:hypothetical protein